MQGIVSRSGVYKVITRIKEIGSSTPRVRTPPRPVRTPQLIKSAQQKIQRNCRRSARQLAKDANISHVTMQKLLKNDLKKTSYKIVKQQLLSQQTEMMRLRRGGKELLQRLLDGTQSPVLWIDEKLFTVQAVHNCHNDRYWDDSREAVPVEERSSFRRQKPASVMVWAGVTNSRLKTPLIFIEKGVKINQPVYLHMLKETVHPWVVSDTEPSGITFQQDGARSHMAKLVQDWCQVNFKGLWPKNLWPPSSSDVKPMDFVVWSMFEQWVCSTSHRSVAVLKRKLSKWWEEIPANTLRAMRGQVIPTLR